MAKKAKITKITVRDYNDVLKTATDIASKMVPKTSLNSYIIDAIKKLNEKNSHLIKS